MFVPTHTADVYRSSKWLVEQAAYSATPTVARQPARASRLQVVATGAPSGLLTVSGTVGGSSTTEGFSWSGTAGFVTGWKAFTSISGITAALTGATLLSVAGLGEGGEPQTSEYLLKQGIPVGIDRTKISTRPTWENPMAGSAQEGEGIARFFREDTWRPREGDHITLNSGERYVIVAVREGTNLAGPFTSEWFCTITREEA